MKILALSLAAAALSSCPALAGSALSTDGKVRTFTVGRPAKALDPAMAAPMRLPLVRRPLPSLVELTIEAAKSRHVRRGGVSAGGEGGAELIEAPEPPAAAGASELAGRIARAEDGAAPPPPEYGTSGQPYTMARAPSVTRNPYRRAGRLAFTDASGQLFFCSAALIKPGVAVTAAHCIVPYGSTEYFQYHTYLPAWGAPADYLPEALWDATSVSVLSSWTDGTGSCTTRGVVCEDDIGVVTLAAKNGAHIGAKTGWFAYSTNNYSYRQGQVQVAQLGYSSGFDNADLMMRTDSQGSVGGPRYSRNTIIGSPLGDGADGGPWVVNLGLRPVVSWPWSRGEAAASNVIVGVTSWSTGEASSEKQAGASPFLPGNIGVLVSNACSATPSAC